MFNLLLITFLGILAFVYPNMKIPHFDEEGESERFFKCANKWKSYDLIPGIATKCELHCLMIATGFIVNGTINANRFREKNSGSFEDENMLTNLETKCTSIKNNEKCGLGSELAHCMYRMCKTKVSSKTQRVCDTVYG